MKGRVHGVNHVLEGQVRQRRAPTAVRRQRRADDLEVDGPLPNRIAYDAHARHLRVRRGLLEVVCAERRDLVGAGSRAPLDHQVGDRKIDVKVLRDDFAVDEIVQLWVGQIQRRESPSRRVGIIRSGYGGPRRDRHSGLNWGKGTIKRLAPRPSVVGVSRVKKRRLIHWCCHGRRARSYGKECR